MTARNTIAKLTLADPGTTGTAIAINGDEEFVLCCVVGTATDGLKLTVKAGNGLQGVADLELDISAAATYLLKLESGKYKNVSGDNKGKIVVKASTASKCTVGTAELA